MKRLKTSIKWLFASFVGLYLLIWLASPYAIKHFLSEQLALLNLSISQQSSISYNPFITRVSMQNVALLQNDKSVAVINSAEFQISLIQLLFKKVSFQYAAIDGLSIVVEQVGEIFNVAGVSVSGQNQSKVSESEKINSDKNTFPFEVILPKFELTNSDINLSLATGSSHHVLFKSLSIKDVFVNSANQNFELTLNSELDSSELSLSVQGQFEQQASIGVLSVQSNIDNYLLANLSPYIEPLNISSGDVSIELNSTIKIENESIAITLNHLAIDSKALELLVERQKLLLAEQGLKLNEGELVLKNGKIAKVSTSGQLNLNSLAILEGEDKLAEIGKLSIDNFDVAGLNDVLIPLLAIDKLSLSEKVQAETPALARLDAIKVSDITLSQKKLNISSISLDSITSEVWLDQNKRIETLLASLQQQSEVESKDLTQDVAINGVTEGGTREENNDQQTYGFSLAKFEIVGDNIIRFRDKSVTPEYSRDISLDEVSLLELSTLSPEFKSPFVIKGRSDKYATFSFDGHVSPFSKTGFVRTKGDVKEVSLPEISPYLKEALGFELLSGQLDSELDFALQGEQIKGKVDINMRGLETSAANDEQVASIKDQTAIPLNSALAMLKDDNGNIVLDIPFSGTTSDPSFGVTSFIALITKKAVMSTAKSYLINTFVPYANVVSVALSAGDYLLKLRFEDLLYQDKQVELDVSQQDYINQFIALMIDKPDTTVKVCGIAVNSELGLASSKELLDAEKNQLMKIASNRQQNFKDAVVATGKVPSSRLLLCAPQIDSSGQAKPRIILSTN